MSECRGYACYVQRSRSSLIGLAADCVVERNEHLQIIEVDAKPDLHPSGYRRRLVYFPLVDLRRD